MPGGHFGQGRAPGQRIEAGVDDGPGSAGRRPRWRPRCRPCRSPGSAGGSSTDSSSSTITCRSPTASRSCSRAWMTRSPDRERNTACGTPPGAVRKREIAEPSSCRPTAPERGSTSSSDSSTISRNVPQPAARTAPPARSMRLMPGRRTRGSIARAKKAAATPVATSSTSPPTSRPVSAEMFAMEEITPPSSGPKRKASTVPATRPARSRASRTSPRYQPRTARKSRRATSRASIMPAGRRARSASACCPCPCSRS